MTHLWWKLIPIINYNDYFRSAFRESSRAFQFWQPLSEGGNGEWLVSKAQNVSVAHQRSPSPRGSRKCTPNFSPGGRHFSWECRFSQRSEVRPAHWSTGRAPTGTTPITQNVDFCPKEQLVDCLSERRPAVHRWHMAWWPNWKVFKKKSLRTQMGLPNLRK